MWLIIMLYDKLPKYNTFPIGALGDLNLNNFKPKLKRLHQEFIRYKTPFSAERQGEGLS